MQELSAAGECGFLSRNKDALKLRPKTVSLPKQKAVGDTPTTLEVGDHGLEPWTSRM